MLHELKSNKALSHPVMAMLAGMMGNNEPERELRKGFWLINTFNGDMMLWGRNAPERYMGWPTLPDGCGDINAYGVCDTPEQFMDRYAAALEACPHRTFFTTFTHVAKDPTNAGQGGGWRWHKWGPYIGDHKHECEYLDDEVGFENGIYVYHVYQTAGPEK